MTDEEIVCLVLLFRYAVYFFGTEETGVLTTDSMWQYNLETKAKHMKHTKKEFYSEGLAKIQRAFEDQTTMPHESQKIVPGAEAASTPRLAQQHPASTSVPPTSLSCCTSLLGALQSDHQANLDEQDVAPLRSHIHCCTSYSCFVCIPGQLLMLASVKVPGRCLLPLSPVGRVDPGLAKAEVGQGRVDPGLVKVPAR